jgi:hypothetical protein
MNDERPPSRGILSRIECEERLARQQRASLTLDSRLETLCQRWHCDPEAARRFLRDMRPITFSVDGKEVARVEPHQCRMKVDQPLP